MSSTSKERKTTVRRTGSLLGSIADALRSRNEQFLTAAKLMLCVVFVFLLTQSPSPQAQEIELIEDNNTGLIILKDIYVSKPEVRNPILGSRDKSHSLEDAVRRSETQKQSARNAIQWELHGFGPPTLDPNGHFAERMRNLRSPSTSIAQPTSISLERVIDSATFDRPLRGAKKHDVLEGLRQTAITTLTSLGGASTGALVGLRTKSVNKAFKAGVVTANSLTPVVDKSTRWLGNAIAESLMGGQHSHSSQAKADLGHTVRQTALTATTTIAAGVIGTGTIAVTSDTGKGIAAAVATANFVKPALDIGTKQLGNAIGNLLFDLTAHERGKNK